MEQPTQEQSRGWAGWQAEHGEEHAAQAQEAECATDATMRADAAGAPRLARRAAAARTVKACKSYAHTCKSRSAIVVCATQEGKARKRSPIQCAADLRGCEHQEEEGEQARQHDILMIERSMESTRARERDLVPRKARGHAR